MHEKFLGADHQDTPLSINTQDLVMAYLDLNRLNEMEELDMKAMKAREKDLGGGI